ncbi:MAG TPA: amidohydrolase, partial [Armatimonadota bacterium]|nr:amidohydrolase [Armatimonadota bacterium]
AERVNLRPGDGRWLLGRGFDQELLAEGRWPTREDLDAVSPDVPLRISRVCGHALVANTTALRAACLDAESNSSGLPAGVLTETAMSPIFDAVPEPSATEWLEAARWACAEAARVGFVGVHSLMADTAEVRALIDLHREGALPVRVQMQLPFALLEQARQAGLRSGFGDEYLQYGAIKLFGDGSLGARTAALLDPYSDDPATSGELIHEPEELNSRVRQIVEAGFQPCIHAIGDRAMDAALDAIELAGRAPDLTPVPSARIEHASLVSPRIIQRMRDLGVGAAVQPQFVRSDPWMADRLGAERARYAYAFRTMWQAGVPLAGSTDCPVEELDAMAAIGQMVYRPEWASSEALPLAAALRIFSEGSYAVRGCAPEAGRLAPGGYADFVVLDRDPRAVTPEEIETVEVAMTVVGGEVRYAR